MFLKVFTPFLKYNLFLLIYFSISVNTFVNIENINIIFYIFFHLTFFYFLFYHYHYSLYFLGFIYGILFDIFFINEIGSHLLSFIILIFTYNLFKKFLFLLSFYQIYIFIYITLITILFFEGIFAFLFNNIYFTYLQMTKYIIISLLIYIPSIFSFYRLDR